MDIFKLNDIKIFKKLGRKVYIRNGVGFGFISDKYLYDNCFLEIGIGRTRSGYGDWGGGFDTATTCPLKITIDKNYIIQKHETDSFYNSESSQEVEKIAEKLIKKLKIRTKFIIKDKELKNGIDSIFEVLPSKRHIGWDVFHSPHMLKYFIEDSKKLNF